MFGRADQEVRGQEKLANRAEVWNKAGEGLQERSQDGGEADERAEKGGGVQRCEGEAVHGDASLEEGLHNNSFLSPIASSSLF